MNPILKSFIRLLYPSQCRKCGENLDPSNHYICNYCWKQTELIESPFCQACGFPLAFIQDFSEKKHDDIHFRKSRSITYYYESNYAESQTDIIDSKIGNSCARCPRDIKPLFCIDFELHDELNIKGSYIIGKIKKGKGRIPSKLLAIFDKNSKTLSDKAFILMEKKDYSWQIKDSYTEYLIRREDKNLNVYGFEFRKGEDRLDQSEEKQVSVVGEAIQLLKYSGKMVMANPLAKLMAENFPKLLKADDYDIIIPLPIHRSKLKKRGYNQVELIGWILSKEIGITIDTQSLIKTIETESQVGASYLKREINLKGVFDISDTSRIKGKRILLIDDVMTTGASVNESSKVLIAKGKAEYVDVLAIARAV